MSRTVHKWLKDPIPPERLVEIYHKTDYYWYLRSNEFIHRFLQPVAEFINNCISPGCLDVCCGEGQLATLINGPYVGFDASPDAIKTARTNYPNKTFIIETLERFPSVYMGSSLGTVVFGNIFHCLVHPTYQVEVIRCYTSLVGALHFVVYDLECFDTQQIDSTFSRVSEYHAIAKIPNLEEVKCHRKVIMYKT